MADIIKEIVLRKCMGEMLALWEASVRATHTFLQEADIISLRPAVLQGLQLVPRLFAAHNQQKQLLGFMGLDDAMLEMLFLLPEARGKGLGKAMVNRAIALGVRLVNVNEQNPQALNFYLHMGFKICGRSSLDGQGRPFPLLHLAL